MNSVSSNRVLITGGSGFIGIHLVELLRQRNYSVLNLDITKPIDNNNLDLWIQVSILDRELLKLKILDFEPHFIVHLSAVTTQNATSLDDFSVNIQGTENLLGIANSLTSLNKFIFTSSQYVNSPGLPYSENSDFLVPYGLYGKSKIIGEEMTRNSLKASNWTIIRPTTIWGPWHPILKDGLWKQILRGRYFHPRNDKAVKAYGYVRNTAWQIAKILELDSRCTDGAILYLGDQNIPQETWVNAFVARLTNGKMRHIPKIFLFMLSEIGELMHKVGINFPLYRSRYRNLITSNPSPLDRTLKLLGPSPISFDDAVSETCSWLEDFDNLQSRVN